MDPSSLKGPPDPYSIGDKRWHKDKADDISSQPGAELQQRITEAVNTSKLNARTSSSRSLNINELKETEVQSPNPAKKTRMTEAQSLEDLLGELYENVDKNPGAVTQLVETYVAKALSLPYIKKNKATVIRESLRDLNLGENYENNLNLIKQTLQENAYPKEEQNRDLQNIQAFAEKKYSNDPHLQNTYITLIQETNRLQRGLVPTWVETKRTRPKTLIAMVHQINIASFFHEVKDRNNQEDLSTGSTIMFLGRSGGSSALGAGLGSQRYTQDPDFIKICEQNLPGIGLGKGGISGIMNIMVDDVLFTTWHGMISPTKVGATADTCATLHGPLFGIFDKDSEYFWQPLGIVNEFPEDCIIVYLVPKDEDKIKIYSFLDFAEENKFITSEKKEILKNKVKTYQEYASSFL
jgi:hypothetical protein